MSSVEKRYRCHKRLQFLISYLLTHGWIVKMSDSGQLKFKRPGRHTVYTGSLRYSSKRGLKR
jgi:hypothetical protein